jgi:hypothetical protein
VWAPFTTGVEPTLWNFVRPSYGLFDTSVDISCVRSGRIVSSNWRCARRSLADFRFLGRACTACTPPHYNDERHRPAEVPKKRGRIMRRLTSHGHLRQSCPLDTISPTSNTDAVAVDAETSCSCTAIEAPPEKIARDRVFLPRRPAPRGSRILRHRRPFATTCQVRSSRPGQRIRNCLD